MPLARQNSHEAFKEETIKRLGSAEIAWVAVLTQQVGFGGGARVLTRVYCKCNGRRLAAAARLRAANWTRGASRRPGRCEHPAANSRSKMRMRVAALSGSCNAVVDGGCIESGRGKGRAGSGRVARAEAGPTAWSKVRGNRAHDPALGLTGILGPGRGGRAARSAR